MVVERQRHDDVGARRPPERAPAARRRSRRRGRRARRCVRRPRGSAPKRRRQSPSDRSATRCRPMVSSSAGNRGRCAGVTPSTVRNAGDTSSARTRSGSPMPVRLYAPEGGSRYAAIAENDRLSRRQSKKSAGAIGPNHWFSRGRCSAERHDQVARAETAADARAPRRRR